MIIFIIFVFDISSFELDLDKSHENLGARSDCSDKYKFSFYIMNSEVICNIDTILVFSYVTWSLVCMIRCSLLENVIKFSEQFLNPYVLLRPWLWRIMTAQVKPQNGHPWRNTYAFCFTRFCIDNDCVPENWINLLYLENYHADIVALQFVTLC